MPKNPEADRELFRRDQSDLDGTFLLRNVIPGSYTLLAIENGWDLDWSQPGVIAAYLKRGRESTNLESGQWTNERRRDNRSAIQIKLGEANYEKQTRIGLSKDLVTSLAR